MIKRVSISLWRYTGLCTNGHEFVTYQFPDFHVGEGVIRTSNPYDIAVVKAIGDPMYEEIASIVKDLLTIVGKEVWYGRCFEQVFGIACDPAPSGQKYSLTEKVRCPICGTTTLVRYGPGKSPNIEIIELPCVTYEAWQQLSYEQKRERMHTALREVGCME